MLTFWISILVMSGFYEIISGKNTPKVYLTVSSLTHTRFLHYPDTRKVVINYYNADCYRMMRANPFIALYNHDPETSTTDPIFLYRPSDCPEGRIETNYTFPNLEFTKKDLVSKCLRYWVAYLESGRIAHSSCIKTHPTWMYDMRKDIGDMTLNCLMIPGTHNSALYYQYNALQDTIFEKYMYTQEESVFNQLVYGNRFLDLRVWHEGASMWKSKIQITHDKIHLGLPYLQDILNEIKNFVVSTKEFVIVDFHRLLSGHFMSKTLLPWQHNEIIKLVKDTFGDLIIGYDFYDLTLEELWQKNKRVLISYRDQLDSPESIYITYPVHHWHNTSQSIKDLHEYLVNTTCSVPYFSTAAVAVLTPTLWTPLIDSTYSRRKTAEKVNTFVDKWFRNELSCSNVVLTDYFLGNNVIEIAIDANKNLNRCDITYPDNW